MNPVGKSPIKALYLTQDPILSVILSQIYLESCFISKSKLFITQNKRTLYEITSFILFTYFLVFCDLRK